MKSSKIIPLGLLLLTMAGCGKESFGERMVRECRENTAKLCPMEVDKDTKLDSMAFDIPKHTLYYYYSLHGPLDNDSLYTEDVVAAHHETLVNDIKNSVTLRDIKAAKANFGCIYLSASTGKVLLQYDIKAEEYSSVGMNEIR